MAINFIFEKLDKAGITYQTGPPTNKDSLGKVYRTLVIGGDKSEGAYLPLYCSSRPAAQDYYYKYLLEFLGTDRHIVWRTLPVEEFEYKFVTIYSRLVSYPSRPKLPGMF